MMEKTAVFNALPPVPNEEILPQIQAMLARSGRKLVVLDDDPTGTQTVHNLPVLTDWSVDQLVKTLRDPQIDCFYILTNSRSLHAHEANRLAEEIGRSLREAGRQTAVSFDLVSRSDSTLRGHFPNEVHALARGLQHSFDGWLLIPFFEEGGRFTIKNMHLVADGDRLLPAAETPFAQDHSFGYRESNLRRWVAEKTAGSIPADAVLPITIAELRSADLTLVKRKLMALQNGAVCVVNAACYADLERLTLALLAVEAAGKRFLYRTAASFVRVRAGLASRPLLTANELGGARSAYGGLIVVGSYVQKTTQQLNYLMREGNITAVELATPKLLDELSRAVEIGRAAAQVNTAVRRGEDVVLYTSRTLITGMDQADSLRIGQLVSEALVQIVQQLAQQPRFLIAKGGITSSDVATHGLGMKQAMVLGQILPGIPVWRMGRETRFPAMAYVVFPGNVGDVRALSQVVHKFSSLGEN